MLTKSFKDRERASVISNASVVEKIGGTTSRMPPPLFASNNNAPKPVQRFTDKTIQKEEEETQEAPIIDNEFESMNDFRNQTGQTTLGKYQWLKADREAQSGTWETAMTNMTQDQEPDVLLPFEQIKDYYVWVSRKLDAKGHESRWVKGALYLVGELSDTYDEGITPGRWWAAPGRETIPLLEDLNVGIANYAITQFHRLLYGDLSEDPLVGEAAYQFDKQFIETEQGEIAQDIYAKYDGTETLETMNRIFNGTGIDGNLVEFASSEIPTFPDYFQTDLTDADSNYGRAQRTDIPLFMLYPDRHQTEENYEQQETILGYSIGDPRNLQDLMNQRHLDGNGLFEGMEDRFKDMHNVYETFHNVNQTIMDKEW